MKNMVYIGVMCIQATFQENIVWYLERRMVFSKSMFLTDKTHSWSASFCVDTRKYIENALFKRNSL